MTDQNILDSLEEDKEIEQMIAARTSFAAALDKDKLLEILRNIVDVSDCFDFISKRTRRYISASRPELLLEIDLVKATNKYPQYAEDLYVTDNSPEALEKVRDARSHVAQAELMSNLVDFFTATFKYVLEGSIPEYYSRFENNVLAIIDNRSIEVLRDQILNIFDVKDRSGNPTGELGFIFSVTAAVKLPSNDDLESDTSVTVELVY